MSNSKPLLELVMIVKDSGKDLIEMLKAAKPHIDRWTILDTGSTDGTMENIRKTLSGIEGNLHDGKEMYEDPFVDFSTARNRALELAGKRCIFTIMLDDTYQIKDGVDLRKMLKKAKRERFSAYNINIEDDQSSYNSHRILRTAAEIRYKYKIHEIVDVPEESTSYRSLGTVKDASSTYMQRRSQARVNKDIKLLSEALEEEPTNRRLRLHLARTLATSVIHDEEEKIELCKKQLETLLEENKKDSWDYEARILNVILDMDTSRLNDTVRQSLEETAEAYPESEEVPYLLTVYHRSKNNYKEAFEWVIKAAEIAPKLGKGINRNTVNTRIHKFEIPYLFADLAIQNGKLDAAEKVLKKFAPLNNDTRLFNMIYAIANIPQPTGKTLNGPILVIHATDSVRGWSPNNIRGVGEAKGSGSEIMAINVAKSFARKRYRVFVFGDFAGKHEGEEYDTQGMYQGVQYMDSSAYWDFLKEYQVDILIASRDVSNLVYIKNVKKVFLWVHDVLPNNSVIKGLTIQYHQQIFKRILCLCNWHKDQIQRRLGVQDEKIHVTRNAILPYRFSRRPKKISHRYIYTSSADRGLDNLLEMIQKVKKRFSETTLHIFTAIKNTAKGDEFQLRSMISSLDYVTLHSRVSQEELAHELLISDVWLYPTAFTETYCIAALEAQAAGLLCACTNVAALKEIVSDRGVMVEGSGNNENVRKELLDQLCQVLDDPIRKSDLQEKARTWAATQGFDELTSEWEKDLFCL